MKLLILLVVYHLALVAHCQVETCSSPNEVYNECGNRCREPTCELGMIFAPCVEVCDAGCFCMEGFVRDITGQCVLEENCLKKSCLENEVIGCSIPGCEPVCKTPLSEFCLYSKQACRAQCVCKKGFILAQGEGPRRCKPVAQCRLNI